MMIMFVISMGMNLYNGIATDVCAQYDAQQVTAQSNPNYMAW